MTEAFDRHLAETAKCPMEAFDRLTGSDEWRVEGWLKKQPAMEVILDALVTWMASAGIYSGLDRALPDHPVDALASIFDRMGLDADPAKLADARAYCDEMVAVPQVRVFKVGSDQPMQVSTVGLRGSGALDVHVIDSGSRIVNMRIPGIDPLVGVAAQAFSDLLTSTAGETGEDESRPVILGPKATSWTEFDDMTYRSYAMGMEITQEENTWVLRCDGEQLADFSFNDAPERLNARNAIMEYAADVYRQSQEQPIVVQAAESFLEFWTKETENLRFHDGSRCVAMDIDRLAAAVSKYLQQTQQVRA